MFQALMMTFLLFRCNLLCQNMRNKQKKEKKMVYNIFLEPHTPTVQVVKQAKKFEKSQKAHRAIAHPRARLPSPCLRKIDLKVRKKKFYTKVLRQTSRFLPLKICELYRDSSEKLESTRNSTQSVVAYLNVCLVFFLIFTSKHDIIVTYCCMHDLGRFQVV